MGVGIQMQFTGNGLFVQGQLGGSNPPTTTTTTTTLYYLPTFNMTPYNNTAYQTPCFSSLLVGDVKESMKCLYIGTNFQRDDGVYTMGYFFYLIVFGGMTFMFYLKHKNMAASGIIMLIFMAFFTGDMPSEAGVIYYGVVSMAVAVTIYGLFKND